MGFPYDTPTWDGVSGAIFMGQGTSTPGLITAIAIVVCVAFLVIGQAKEASRYKRHK